METTLHYDPNNLHYQLNMAHVFAASVAIYTGTEDARRQLCGGLARTSCC